MIFTSLNDFYLVLCLHFCFLIEKITKGKKPLCELVGAHIYGWTDLGGSTLKMLANEATYFDVLYMQYI